ncbi:MAG: sulfotransferase [Planctomycetes bacterium]|nr:sulfotransferase [Planctomycetota bacterium]
MAGADDNDGLLVTGCFRSGTTLLEKLLHNHPQVSVASQPCPVLYHYTKEVFLEGLGLERRYALDHLFGEDGYRNEDFAAFLESCAFDDARLATLFERLRNYGVGLWTPEVFQVTDRIEPGTFLDVFLGLQRALGTLFGKDDARWFGSKEIVAEEYAPFLVGHGSRVVIIVRDPRDVITSLSFRQRDNQTGNQRPILFSARAWRKSVAFALSCEGHPNFATLRYEDLVADPAGELAKLTEWLAIDPYPAAVLGGEIRDQNGELWRGNSSFQDRVGVTAQGRGGFESIMPPDVAEYVEAICGPEMRALGYERKSDRGIDRELLAGFREPFAVDHAAFSPDYSHSAERVAAELHRAELLAAPDRPDEAELRRWFLDPRAWTRLRAR